MPTGCLLSCWPSYASQGYRILARWQRSVFATPGLGKCSSLCSSYRAVVACLELSLALLRFDGGMSLCASRILYCLHACLISVSRWCLCYSHVSRRGQVKTLPEQELGLRQL